MNISDTEKQEIANITGWSESIINCIQSMDEARVYIRAGLKEAIVGGRIALIRQDIDWGAFNCRKEWLKDKLADWNKWKDYNNADLIGEGYPPRDANGDPYELHHIGQHQDSPFAELTWNEHMGNGNNTILHRFENDSEINRQTFDNEKSQYWQNRFKMFSQADLNHIYNN